MRGPGGDMKFDSVNAVVVGLLACICVWASLQKPVANAGRQEAQIQSRAGAASGQDAKSDSEVKSAEVAKPVQTTICEIAKNPMAFNNELVRVHGWYHEDFEYSYIEDLSCQGGSIDQVWIVFGGGEMPPGVLGNALGNARPGGGKDSEGDTVGLIAVTLVRDANYKKFEKVAREAATGDGELILAMIEPK